LEPEDALRDDPEEEGSGRLTLPRTEDDGFPFFVVAETTAGGGDCSVRRELHAAVDATKEASLCR